MTTHDQQAAPLSAQSASPEFSGWAAEPQPAPSVSPTGAYDTSATAPTDTTPAEHEPPIVNDEASTTPVEPSQTDNVPTSAEVQSPSEADRSSGVQSPSGELLFAADASGLRSRWDDIQAVFVDDPAECVHKADALVAEIVEQVTAGFSEARSRLEAQWARGEQASTEDLRLALQRYREFFQRLLAA